MKKLMIIIAAFSISYGVGLQVCEAQSLKISRVGEIETANGDARYVTPLTTLVVDITVKHEKIRPGEYARYAQRYLGVIAPLADKDIYIVESARIQWYDTDSAHEGIIEPVADKVITGVLHNNPDGDSFMRVLPDKMAASVKPAEDAARDAANMIYNIRKRRMDLVMGDIGENVYGEGLRTAVERLDRMENEYMELFLGKQSITVSTYRFLVVPEKGKNTYVVCRMSENGGILPVADLSGAPVLLELKPQGLASTASAGADSRRKSSGKSDTGAEYIVADMVSCRVTDGNKDLATATVPVYQMGTRITR